MSLIQAFCVLLAVISLAECGKDKKCKAKSVVTFNAGLTPIITNYQTRRDLIPGAINSIDADVVCLQEVWFERDMKKIIDTVKNTFPYAYSPIHDDVTRCCKNKHNSTPPDSSPSCSQTDPSVQAFQQCAGGCATAPDLRTCIVIKCLNLGFAMPQKCITCFILGLQDFATIGDFCFTPNNRVNMVGLLILSRNKIKSAKTTRYLDIPGVKMLIPRSYLDTKICGIGDVICTHLTSDTGPYLEGMVAAATAGNLNISSWQKQQEDEIATLRAHLASSKKHILLGDMNTGPVTAKTEGMFPDNYARLANGYYNHYFDNADAECSFCSTNGLTDNSPDILIDHVMVKGYETTSSKQVLKTAGDGVTLSDHYGVQTDVCM